MKIYIVKHYWKNGENSTWERHKKVNNDIFEYLKDNYHHFVSERKREVQKNGYYIYLCYEDTKDIFARDITNVIFFISKEKLTILLCEQTYNNLELIIETKKSKLLFVSILIVFIISLGINFFNISTLPQSRNKLIDKNISKNHIIHDYAPLINNWNQQVQYLTNKKTFLLIRNDNKELIKQLNIFVKPFFNSIETKSDNYRVFLFENHYNKNILFDMDMDRSELKKNLKKITNKTEMSEMVKKILMMNDIDIYFHIKNSKNIEE